MDSKGIQKKLIEGQAELEKLKAKREALLDAVAESELGGPAADTRKLAELTTQVADRIDLNARLERRLAEAIEREERARKDAALDAIQAQARTSVAATIKATKAAATAVKAYLSALAEVDAARAALGQAMGALDPGLDPADDHGDALMVRELRRLLDEDNARRLLTVAANTQARLEGLDPASLRAACENNLDQLLEERAEEAQREAARQPTHAMKRDNDFGRPPEFEGFAPDETAPQDSPAIRAAKADGIIM